MPTALIVEDEPEANQLLSMLVQLRGYETVSAFTGSEALVKVERDRPDIVFLDLMLPDINGFDVCRTLKSSRPTSSIPVVMVTARLADENRLMGFRAGATDYVPKPYTPDQIFEAMAHAVIWQREIADGHEQGTIALKAGDDIAHLGEITRLRCLLLTHTRLSEDAAHTLDRVLVELALRAVDWGGRANAGLVASIEYRWDDRGATIALIDESGWFGSEPPMRPGGIGPLISRSQFDEVDFDQTSSRVTMTCRFPDPR